MDLRAQREDRTLLLEVETGKSTVLDNITKREGHGKLIMFFTSKAAYDAIREQLPPTTITLTLETINQLHTIIQ